MLTVIMSGPKRSGTTLLNRLFDSQDGIIDLNDEAFFWEHAYNYHRQGCSELFLDLFRMFPSRAVRDGFIDRDLLPWVEGVYRQDAVAESFRKSFAFDAKVFLGRLDGLKQCENVQQVWHLLVTAYAAAMPRDYSGCDAAFIKAADYGRSILGGHAFLTDCKGLTIIRNPYFAIDSLKKSRAMRGQKLLHPFNLGEVILDYLFWWGHLDAMRSADTLLLEYERLVMDPEPVMRRVAAHLGILFTDNLLRPTLLGEPWGGLSSFASTDGIDRQALARPLKVLDVDEVAFIGRSLAPMLERFGYTPQTQVSAAAGPICA